MNSSFMLQYLFTSAASFMLGVGCERLWKEHRVA